MQKSICLLILPILISTFLVAQEEKETKEPEFSAYWKQGFRVESDDGHYKFKFGGRLMNDWALYQQTNNVRSFVGDMYAGTEFRRARLFSSGLFYNSIKYKLQFDFAGGDADFKDAYLEFTKIPGVGNLRIGHFFEPFGMEQNTSSKYITFMERAVNDAFTPGRNTGFMLHNQVLNDRMTWAAGVFRQTGSYGETANMVDYYNYSARFTGTPIYKEDKHQIVHLGLAYTFRNPNEKMYSASSTPESHMANTYVSTGLMQDVTNVSQIGYEAALFWGPFSAQAEFNSVSVNQSSDTTQTDYLFAGYYGLLSYFITGENRNYKTGNGTIGRTYPNQNFMNGEGGPGAIELVVRYSGLDLNSENIEGGILNNITAGANWYPNPSTKIMFNYGYANLKNIGFTNIYQMRFQVDF